MAKFQEILRLHTLGHSQCAIAQNCGVAYDATIPLPSPHLQSRPYKEQV